ncbi:MAG: DUF4062 domain-containing protein, partial [Vulcanimicrobiaceae bacterium]
MFLASPGDLNDERVAARDVVDNLLSMLRGRQVAVELLGWEDTRPNAGRPQALINKDVDQADIFVGLLYRRWGQSPGDPRYSSGFEEEFARAVERRERTGSPDIWLYFKEVDQLSIQDAGDQLQKVLEFRQMLVTGKKLLFKNFKTTEEWTNLFRSALFQLLFDQLSPGTSEPTENRASQLDDTPDSAALAIASPNAISSLSPVIEFLETLVAEERSASESWPQSANTLEAARLYTVGLAALSHIGASTDAVGIHEINVLFRFRERFEPLPIEEALLRRSVLGDDFGSRPGWYWFPQERDDQIVSAIDIAAADPDSQIRNTV